MTGAKVGLHGKPDGLRAAVLAEFAHAGGEWELRVQLATDLETTPIEHPVAVWPEDATPFVTVARLVAPPQTGWSEPRRRAVDDGMGFPIDRNTLPAIALGEASSEDEYSFSGCSLSLLF